jgi:hypothetical protein
MPTPRVVAVSRDESHGFSKVPAESITLVAGLGVLGDAHAGTLVQHRSRVRRDPNQPNLRAVHLLQAEVFDDARATGFELGPGDLGENVLTADLDLLGLPTGTLLNFGGPVVRLTGLRNPAPGSTPSARVAQGRAVPHGRDADRRAGPVDRLAGVRDRTNHSQGRGDGSRRTRRRGRARPADHGDPSRHTPHARSPL